MKFPWSSSEKTSKKNTELIQKNDEKELKQTYKISSMPENLQKIAKLIQQTDNEIKYLNKKLEVNLIAKKELEQNLSVKLNAIKDST
tara:strand:- start:214 stop:474 length:261 start_codon:yes stop_codon:yes gene_type:complete